MTETEAKVVAAWREAAAKLGFQFTSPFVVTLPDGNRQKHLGLVHHFGRRVGTLISVLHEPSEHSRRPTSEDYYWSVIGPGYGQYNRDDFIETLDDWGYFGPVERRPDWYTPATHWGGQMVRREFSYADFQPVSKPSDRLQTIIACAEIYPASRLKAGIRLAPYLSTMSNR